MPSACGVTWSGTSGGKLNESAIPSDDFKSHYINAGDTKSSSSFPVVDASGNLRAGNVRSAWKLRTQGEGVSESCLRKMANAFEESPLPESANNNSIEAEQPTPEDFAAMSLDPDDARERVYLADDDTEDVFGMNLEFSVHDSMLTDGFNEHGVRANDDGSVDVRFAAMEPGVRRGVEVTEEFLRNVASHDYSRIPVQLDHSQSQRANVGFVDPRNIHTDNFLQTEIHIPDTGSSIRNDIIADFTHDPPQITDISVSFDPRSVEVERPSKRGEPARFVDARLREFSLTPFPAGYDNGGLTPAFSSAVEKTALDCSEFSEPEEFQSQLITRPHILIQK